MGIPTYPEGTLSHNPRAENLQMALFGVRRGLTRASLKNWQGVAIFADYTSTDKEWQEFRALWPRD